MIQNDVLAKFKEIFGDEGVTSVTTQDTVSAIGRVRLDGLDKRFVEDSTKFHRGLDKTLSSLSSLPGL